MVHLPLYVMLNSYMIYSNLCAFKIWTIYHFSNMILIGLYNEENHWNRHLMFPSVLKYPIFVTPIQLLLITPPMVFQSLLLIQSANLVLIFCLICPVNCTFGRFTVNSSYFLKLARSLKLLYYSLVHSILEYRSVIWDPQLSMLTNLFNLNY